MRALHAGIYAVLLLGAATMVYPFLVMLSGSTKSAVDIKHNDLFPAFLHDDGVLYRKYVEGLFNESIDALNITYYSDYPAFDDVVPPRQVNERRVALWNRFLAEARLPAYAVAGGYMRAEFSRTIPSGLRAFKAFLAARYGESIAEVNQALGMEFPGWNEFYVIPEGYYGRRRMPPEPELRSALWAFKARQPPGHRFAIAPEGFFKRLYLKNQYAGDIAEYNRAHGTDYPDYDAVHLSRRLPTGTPRERRDWMVFVREILNLLWVRVDPAGAPAYRRFLEAKYGDIATFNRHYESDYNSFQEVPLIETPPFFGIALTDWNAVVNGWKDPETGTLHRIPAEALRVNSVEFLFRDFLSRQWASIEALNRHWGTEYGDFLDVLPPQREAHYQWYLENRDDLRWEFATRNYKTVFDYLIVHGRGIVNTAIYCGLSVLFALLVNPLAAYAMSRYKMASTYKVLLFLMLTMAFPPMVTQIPSFLLLRELRLLNTFAALVLPGIAQGYSIFLLKGFFDSLPRDLYESAQIDGASEWTMFWQITMSLSKPILAVIALQAFTLAYSNFMFALLICQDERMWTLMVWLYQLQQRSGQAVMYASLIIAAVPTLIIFLFCQNIIIRGIVVPVEK